jgi:hypothetical protein|tara:strand:- start:781 stop:1218 length:438 start_codon:yes stop_codon:yes gene_type:complete
MGADKKIGIEAEDRRIAQRYATRFGLVDFSLKVSRTNGLRAIYFTGTDYDGVIYRLKMSKLKQMRSPKGTQVVNRYHYLVVQSEKVHGVKYDYSLIKEEDITFSNKLKIICPVHGVFHKRKSAHVTDREGCPQCSANRLRQLRKF